MGFTQKELVKAFRFPNDRVTVQDLKAYQAYKAAGFDNILDEYVFYKEETSYFRTQSYPPLLFFYTEADTAAVSPH